MATKSDIEGREFDWFGLDQGERPALFATSGEGRVPGDALAFAEVHRKIGESIEVTQWGTEMVWQGYARVGLYVYDWDVGRQCYMRVAEPTAPIPSRLLAAIGGIERIPRLNVDFASARAIDVS